MNPAWTENDWAVDNIRLHYARAGRLEKTALVLVHGVTDSGKCWLSVVMELKEDYDIVLPDARGHGLSARLQRGETVDLAADLSGLVRHLGLDQPILIGHSLGATISARVGVQNPGLVRALILEDPPWRLAAEPEEQPSPGNLPPPNPFVTMVSELVKKDLEEIIAQCRADHPTWPEAELRPWAESKKQFDISGFQDLGAARRGWRELVPRITCPTLLITADSEYGAAITPEVAQMAASLNSFVQIANVPGAGHSIRRENFTQYMAVVRGFLKDEIGNLPFTPLNTENPG